MRMSDESCKRELFSGVRIKLMFISDLASLDAQMRIVLEVKQPDYGGLFDVVLNQYCTAIAHPHSASDRAATRSFEFIEV